MSRTYRRIPCDPHKGKTGPDGKKYWNPRKAPKAWRNMMTERPARRRSDHVCHHILKGLDQEELLFDPGNKPGNYYY